MYVVYVVIWSLIIAVVHIHVLKCATELIFFSNFAFAMENFPLDVLLLYYSRVICYCLRDFSLSFNH